MRNPGWGSISLEVSAGLGPRTPRPLKRPGQGLYVESAVGGSHLPIVQ